MGYIYYYLLVGVIGWTFIGEIGGLKLNREPREVFTIKDNNVTATKLVIANNFYDCLVRVGVYQTPEFKKAVRGVTVTVLTRERNSGASFVYSDETTDVNGQACVLTRCRDQGVIFVTEKAASSISIRLYADSRNDSILKQIGYPYQLQSRNEEVNFTVLNFGIVYNKRGPVYSYRERNTCMTADASNHQFNFSRLGVKETLYAVALPLNEYLKSLSWYYYSPDLGLQKFCFLKVKMLITAYHATIEIASYDDTTGILFGRYKAGPKENPLASNKTIKAACLEIRCALIDLYDNPMNTKLAGSIDVPTHPNGCCLRPNCGLRNLTGNSTSFSVGIHVNDNYGANVGIYISDRRDTALALCYTGKSDLVDNYDMDPTTNYAIEYDCTRNPSDPCTNSCPSFQPIVGK